MMRAYCRCNGGHYFTGENCPFDGWSSAESKELTRLIARFASEGRAASLRELREAGMSSGTLKGVIVMEFGNDAAAFDAIEPREYIIEGEAKELLKLHDHNFF